MKAESAFELATCNETAQEHLNRILTYIISRAKHGYTKLRLDTSRLCVDEWIVDFIISKLRKLEYSITRIDSSTIEINWDKEKINNKT
jgi:hypothetical protein